MPDPAAIPPAPDPEAWASAWAVVGYLGAVGAALGGLARAWAPVIRLARHALGVDALEAEVAALRAENARLVADMQELTRADPTATLAALRESIDALRADLARPPDRPRGR